MKSRDDMLAEIVGGGWDSLDFAKTAATIKEQAGQVREAARAKALVLQAAFSTPDGQEVLRWLIGETLLRAPSDEELAAKDLHYAILKAKREGQNSITLLILDALAVSRR